MLRSSVLTFIAIACAAALLATAAGCNDDGDSGSGDGTPEATATLDLSSTVPAAFATAPAGDANVFGRVEISFQPYGEGAVAPEGPVAITLLVRGEEEGPPVAHPAAEDGSFAFASAPGEYEIAGLQIMNESLALGPVLHSTGGPVFTVPDEGCTYVGDITYSMYRLPAIEAALQLDLEEELEAQDDAEYELLYLADGGLLQYSGEVSQGDVPEEAAACDVSLGEFADE
jgi:hypothetical protein